MGRARIFCASILCASIVLAPALLFAEPVSQLRFSNYVNDFAHILSADTVSGLNDTCRQLDQQAKAQLAVVTINSLDGSDIESYANDLFHKWGVGSKSTNRGVLILLAVQDHRYRIETGYGLEPILPDGKVGGFGREAVPLLKQGDYNGAVRLLTLRVADAIAQDAGIQLTGAQPPPRSGPSPGGISAAGIVMLIVIVVIVLVTPPLRSVLWWILLSNMGGGYRGSSWGGSGWGGGGFGGGGGGFGGFGGGSSGGGGASGSW